MLIFFGLFLIVLRLLVISSPIFPSPRDKPTVKIPSIYLIDADIPSIFGSAESTNFSEFFIFKKFLIFFKKSSTFSLEKAFAKDSIGIPCSIFLNLPEGS